MQKLLMPLVDLSRLVALENSSRQGQQSVKDRAVNLVGESSELILVMKGGV
jgi:hypothetical protein